VNPARRIGLSLAYLAAALLLHKGFCEWRTLEYAASEEAAHDSLLLLPVRTLRHASGNAGRWDPQDQALRAYDAEWLACYREVHGEPEPGGERARCLAARSYAVVGTTAEAVALGECELERYGWLRNSEALAACLLRRGHRKHPVPRWAFERIGRRFDGPYVTRSGLFAEAWMEAPDADRLTGAVLGVGLPLLLGALALRTALHGRQA
jgi:hypothetical protein